MAPSDSGPHQHAERHTTHIKVEVTVLFIGVVANMATAFLAATWGNITIPYIGEYLTLQILYVALVVEGFVVALAALGLSYKSFRISREFQHTKQAIKEMQSLSDVRETFIHMAQHRLRTPLSGVHWALGLLKSSPRLREEDQELIEKSSGKLEEAEDLLEKMLKMHKSDLSAFELSEKKDQIDMTTLLQEIVDDLEYLAHDKKTEVSFEPSSRIVIAGERYLLKSALTNVIDNAIRYTPEGKVTILVQSVNEGVKIVISDTGIGISPNDQKHLFERFYRGRNARAVDPHQSGVGMYLTRQVVGLHGGSIDVDSVETEGTTFTIILPQD